jgi:hypothetical protein
MSQSQKYTFGEKARKIGEVFVDFVDICDKSKNDAKAWQQNLGDYIMKKGIENLIKGGFTGDTTKLVMGGCFILVGGEIKYAGKFADVWDEIHPRITPDGIKNIPPNYYANIHATIHSNNFRCVSNDIKININFDEYNIETMLSHDIATQMFVNILNGGGLASGYILSDQIKNINEDVLNKLYGSPFLKGHKNKATDYFYSFAYRTNSALNNSHNILNNLHNILNVIYNPTILQQQVNECLKDSQTLNEQNFTETSTGKTIKDSRGNPITQIPLGKGVGTKVSTDQFGRRDPFGRDSNNTNIDSSKNTTTNTVKQTPLGTKVGGNVGTDQFGRRDPFGRDSKDSSIGKGTTSNAGKDSSGSTPKETGTSSSKNTTTNTFKQTPLGTGVGGNAGTDQFGRRDPFGRSSKDSGSGPSSSSGSSNGSGGGHSSGTCPGGGTWGQGSGGGGWGGLGGGKCGGGGRR